MWLRIDLRKVLGYEKSIYRAKNVQKKEGEHISTQTPQKNLYMGFFFALKLKLKLFCSVRPCVRKTLKHVIQL